MVVWCWDASAYLRISTLATVVAVLMLIEVAILAFGRKALWLTTLELVIVVRSHGHTIIGVDVIHLTGSTSCCQVLSTIHLARLLKNLSIIIYVLSTGLRRHTQARAIGTSHFCCCYVAKVSFMDA